MYYTNLSQAFPSPVLQTLTVLKLLTLLFLLQGGKQFFSHFLKFPIYLRFLYCSLPNIPLWIINMSSRLRALKSVKKNVYAPEAGIGGLTILTPLKSVLEGLHHCCYLCHHLSRQLIVKKYDTFLSHLFWTYRNTVALFTPLPLSICLLHLPGSSWYRNMPVPWLGWSSSFTMSDIALQSAT